MMTPDYSEQMILLADLSLSTTSVSDLFEAIRCSLSWQYGEDSVISLKAIILRNPKQAFVFLDNTSIAERLASEPMIHLSGPLTASFSRVGDKPTEYIFIQSARDIQLSYTMRDIKGILKDPDDASASFSCSFYCRRSSIIIKLPSSEVAANVQQKLSTVSGVQSSCIVTADRFTCVECFWNSTITLTEAMNRLRRSGQSLSGLIGGFLCLLDEQPCIVDVTVLTRSTQSTRHSSPDLVLVCCTENDADMVRACGRIELGMIGSISVASTHDMEERGSEKSDASVLSSEGTIDTAPLAHIPTPISSSRGPSIKECYVFWDMENCPLSSDDAVTVNGNLDDAFSQAVGSGWNVRQISSTKLVFLAHDTSSAYKPTSKQLNDLVDMQYRIIGYVKRSGTDSGIKGEVDAMIRRHRGDETKPAVCLVTGDWDFGPMLNTLLAEGFCDTLLVHSSGSRSGIVSLAPKALPWCMVRQLHRMSQQDRSCALSFNSNHPNYERLFKKCIVEGEGSSFNGTSKGLSKGVSITKSIRVSRFSMAAHLSNLMKWKEEESANGGAVAGIEEIDDRWVNSHADPCHIEVSIDRDRRKQKVVITGNSEEVVKAKYDFVESTLSTLTHNRKVLRMHGWKTHHREAMMGSLPLGIKAQAFRTTVVFHVTDGHIVSEMMSTSESGLAKMTDYLKNLEPTEADWQFDSKHLIPEPRVRFWNSLRNKYAVMFDKVLKNDKLNVKAWGFGSMMEEAYNDVLAASQGRPAPYTTAPVLQHPSRNRDVGDEGEPIHIALYSFKDKDAGLFYMTYEDMFQRYFTHTYRVSVTPISSPAGASGDTANAIKNGYLVVDIRGRQEDIAATTRYMDSMRGNINSHEVYLSKVDSKKYKEICDLKDSSLSGQVAEAIKTSSVNEDPLDCPGLICIRVRPSMHPKGVKKMSFPTDVSVFVTESANTAALHGSRDGRSPKMERILRKFSDLDLPSLHQESGSYERHSDDSSSATGFETSEDMKLWLSSMSQSSSPHAAFRSPGSEPYSEFSLPSPRLSYTDAVKATGPPGIAGPSPESAPVEPVFKKPVHWPHSSFRYMFLAESMKTHIHSTVDLIKSKFGESVTVTCPYRDKKDASVCLLVEGPQEGVEFGVRAFDEMLARVLEELSSVEVVLSDPQYDKLTAMDLATVKAIQGSAGVHIMLTPSASELSAAPRTVDMRTLQPRSVCSSDTILARLPSFNKRHVNLSVISTSADAEGWTWGVNCLFVILERDDDCGLSQQEAEKLNHGEVLVTTDFESGKTILRARAAPVMRGHHDPSMSTEQLLVSVIGRGLAQADILGMPGIAIVTPDLLNAFASLSTERIQSLTVSAVVEYIRTHQVFNLDRVVCLDVIRNDTSPFKSMVQCSYMAESLCRIVKDVKDCSFPVCNDPVCSLLLGSKAPSSKNNRDASVHSLVLKGTEPCLNTAIDEVKEAITA